MIPANELRIGNLVENTQITYKGMSKVNTQITLRNIFMFESFNPIPITEEWLLKFGFKKGVMVMYIIMDDNEQIQYSLDNNIFSFSFKASYFKKIDVKYIHQLQNLYFALKGEELTLSVT